MINSFLLGSSWWIPLKLSCPNTLYAPQHLNGETVLKAIAIQQGIFIERAADVYTFSHLTFQEYLTAQYIVDHQRIQLLVTDHLFDRRWREVFLLVPGLMRTNADELLLAMERAAAEQMNTPKLCEWLEWADTITSGSPDPYNPAAKRAIVIYVALALALNLALALDHALTLQKYWSGYKSFKGSILIS